jgi:hypothetical protein
MERAMRRDVGRARAKAVVGLVIGALVLGGVTTSAEEGATFVGPPAPTPGIVVKAPIAPPPPPSTKSLLLVYGTGASLDLISTEWGIAQGRATEGNPLLPAMSVRVAVKLLEVGGSTLLDKKLSESRPTLAKILRWTYFASRMVVSIHNLRVGLQERQRTVAAAPTP